MTPDQLPPGVRVKALELDYEDACYFRFEQYQGYLRSDGRWSAQQIIHSTLIDSIVESVGTYASLSEAKAACQRHHEEQACVQRIAKGRDAALSRRVPLERRVGRQNVTTE